MKRIVIVITLLLVLGLTVLRMRGTASADGAGVTGKNVPTSALEKAQGNKLERDKKRRQEQVRPAVFSLRFRDAHGDAAKIRKILDSLTPEDFPKLLVGWEQSFSHTLDVQGPDSEYVWLMTEWSARDPTAAWAWLEEHADGKKYLQALFIMGLNQRATPDVDGLYLARMYDRENPAKISALFHSFYEIYGANFYHDRPTALLRSYLEHLPGSRVDHLKELHHEIREGTSMAYLHDLAEITRPDELRRIVPEVPLLVDSREVILIYSSMLRDRGYTDQQLREIFPGVQIPEILDTSELPGY